MRKNEPVKPNPAIDAETDLETEVETEIDVGSIMWRPDGYYWLTPDGKQEFGPFDTLEMAWADMNADMDEDPSPGETLQEAENEIGIADWIDPETGQPAEGMSPPHIDLE
jgi:hypothetical protein